MLVSPTTGVSMRFLRPLFTSVLLLPSVLSCSSLIQKKSLSEEITSKVESTDQQLLVDRILSLPKELRYFILDFYFTKEGYKPLGSLTGATCLYVKSDFQVEETYFFLQTDSIDIDHLRPTKHKKNPFILASMLDGTPQFAYIIKERHERYFSKYYDEVRGVSYDLQLYGGLPQNVCVGPSSLMVYPSDDPTYPGEIKCRALVHVGWTDSHYSEALCMRSAQEKEEDLTTNSATSYFFNGFEHSKKGDQGAARGSSEWNDDCDWWCGPELRTYKDNVEWKDYEYDAVTCVAMSEEFVIFYSGTSSGKLFSYYACGDISTREGYWRAEPFPVNLEQRIDDIELSNDGKYLWLLSNDKIYRYELFTQRLEECFVVPSLEQEGSEEVEIMNVLRTTPYSTILLLGGTQGTVYLIDIHDGACYVLDRLVKEYAIEDMWWSDEDKVVFLNRSGNIRFCTVSLAKPETYFSSTPKEDGAMYEESTLDLNEDGL